jgi:hypothetical protein
VLVETRRALSLLLDATLVVLDEMITVNFY